MPIYIYAIILFILFLLELGYFRIAERYNIIDRPNERSSHSNVVLRGAGVIFTLAVILFCVFRFFSGVGECYPWFVAGLTLIAAVSFADDVRSLPDSVRLVAQFVAMALMFYQVVAGTLSQDGSMLWNIVHRYPGWLGYVIIALIALVAMIICVGATNIFNFMDGINGITAAYGFSALVSLFIANRYVAGFIDEALIVVSMLSVAVFALFNFREKGKAKCFAGDVGAVGIAFILLFAIGKLVMATGDATWLIFLLLYGVDGCMTICHRILLHENLGQAHRKHAYQLMANELGLSHPAVSLIFMFIQSAISLGFIFLCPNTVKAHLIYLIVALAVLCLGYLIFMKKYYHLHEKYLLSLKNK